MSDTYEYVRLAERYGETLALLRCALRDAKMLNAMLTDEQRSKFPHYMVAKSLQETEDRLLVMTGER